LINLLAGADSAEQKSNTFKKIFGRRCNKEGLYI